MANLGGMFLVCHTHMHTKSLSNLYTSDILCPHLYTKCLCFIHNSVLNVVFLTGIILVRYQVKLRLLILVAVQYPWTSIKKISFFFIFFFIKKKKVVLLGKVCF